MRENVDSAVVVGNVRNAAVRLSTTALPPEKIGGKNYQARYAIVESRHVTYQQKTHVWGYIAPTTGGTWDGYGAVYGGGGHVSSKSESVVQVVYADFDGAENTVELPASVSAREGSTIRLDSLNGVIYAVENISGKQNTRGLRGPADFIALPAWTGFQTTLTIACVISLMVHAVGVALLLAVFPAVTIYRRYLAGKNRKELGNYMGRALATSPA